MSNSQQKIHDNQQIVLPEDRYAEELAFLAVYDQGPKPPGWLLTPQSVVAFICGEQGLRL